MNSFHFLLFLLSLTTVSAQFKLPSFDNRNLFL
jgi:hypothetical protein